MAMMSADVNGERGDGEVNDGGNVAIERQRRGNVNVHVRVERQRASRWATGTALPKTPTSRLPGSLVMSRWLRPRSRSRRDRGYCASVKSSPLGSWSRVTGFSAGGFAAGSSLVPRRMYSVTGLYSSVHLLLFTSLPSL